MAVPPKIRHYAVTSIQWIAYACIVVFLCWQVWDVRHGLGDSLVSVGWSAFGVAAALTVLGTVPGFFAWRRLVAGAGVQLTVTDAAWIYFLSGVTLYLPGAMWPAVTQAALARRVGAPAAKLLAAGLVGMSLTVLSGALVGLLALPRLGAEDPRWWLMLPILLCAGAVMLAPRLLGRLLSLGQRLLRRGDDEVTLPAPRTWAGAIGFYVLGWCCTGLHAPVIAMSLDAPSLSAITLGVGGFALSTVVGAVSPAPAGLGIREAVLGLTLGVLIGGPDLVTLLLLSRSLTTVGHVGATLGVLGLLTGIRCAKWRASTEKS
ncbi:lysylphosphatidylglycerol synthase domain-containing protein [Actinomadura sp. 7K534]|uniref:lysylphosphatidylglycerol synthase domain-containing protein n=1 Tax=Actinomadura sp. 7K534 TaxID=2530366 RepID=UPI00104F2306|nr:lysylphosphatidylglycerol synthase domain-containing protein [Actinomadura sp. 7K534]TDB94048.1 flippase-like domain-containing protein [Actinomadura sp. 7K534]